MSDVTQGPGEARAGPSAKGGGQLVVLLMAVGALARAFGGGGVHGFMDSAVVTGIGWAVIGLLAGALYGPWAGRAVSARRFKSLGPLIAPGTSMIVAWADGPVRQDTIGTLTAPSSQWLILRFNPVEGAAVLEAA